MDASAALALWESVRRLQGAERSLAASSEEDLLSTAEEYHQAVRSHETLLRTLSEGS